MHHALLPLLLLLLPCAGKHTREQNRAATGKVTGGSTYLADGTHWTVALSLKTACQADPSVTRHLATCGANRWRVRRPANTREGTCNLSVITVTPNLSPRKLTILGTMQ